MSAAVEYVTRPGRLEDASGIMELIVQEQWREYSEDYIMELLNCGVTSVAVAADGPLLCVCSGFLINGNHCKPTLFIAKKRFQRMGIGSKTWRALLDTLPKPCSLGLYSMCESVIFYEKLGLKKSNHSLTTVSGVVDKDLLNTTEADGIELSVVEGSLPNELFLYDASVHGLLRKEALETPLRDSEQVILARNNDGNIVGYGAIQRLGYYFNISPFIADNDNIARALLGRLLKQLPAGAPFGASFPTRNLKAADLWKEVGLTNILYGDMTYMYSGHMRERCDEKIYNTFWGLRP